MTTRTAEITMAVVLTVISLALMYESTQGLSIGWVRGTGPGSGAWPFWLSAIMLLSCIATLIRAWRRMTPPSRSEEPFMDGAALRLLGVTVIALSLLLLGTHFIGLYASLCLFLFFYLKILGRHKYVTSIVLTLAIPTVIFVFFEVMLIIPLPKGITEPLFYPIYELVY